MKVDLGAVQETLLIPLYGRAVESGKSRPLVRDPRAAELVAAIDYDFAKFDGGRSLIGSVLRGMVFDHWVREFLTEFPHGTVVEIGAGLNTRFERLGNGTAHWVELDLPDSMALRRRFFADSERRTMIAGSVLDDDWLDTVASRPGPYFFVAEAVLTYLAEADARAAVARIAERFPDGRIAFDTWGRWIIRNQHRHDALRKMSAPLQWACDDPHAVESWHPGLRLLDSSTVGAQSAVRRTLPMPYRVLMPALKALPQTRAYRLNLYGTAHTQGPSSWVTTRDGRRLHTASLPAPPASDAPTVVFEAGAAGSRSSWALVQPLVARFARAVVYDRSGLGRSAPDPHGRTLDRMADDLNDLLDGIGPGPFVLAGHSAGGPIVRLAAARRPDRIAGLVLVDPTDEAATVLFGRTFRRAEKLAGPAGLVLARTGLLPRLYRFLLDAVPADVRADMVREAFTTSAVRTQIAQARTFLDELALWRGNPPGLGDIPVTVISGGRPGDGMSASVRAAANAAHAERAGRHVVAARSGHYVPITEPALIADEIRRLIG
ncbi:alpha/beta fold hydrolase [Actinoplanes bogorensis]|uniref:Alpha/beta fold hydrolase n=1 Tax=Paractinoplanes bogorensis TaxID=1610840 RepID=A0ABS5YXF5_9ACTN|nr:alpha/beta fold hydrolase [Actinoplanes bogorensis]MBU2668107.1 alpha/beta fold hydrolase [Actinoplanes bogorensis]